MTMTIDQYQQFVAQKQELETLAHRYGELYIKKHWPEDKYTGTSGEIDFYDNEIHIKWQYFYRGSSESGWIAIPLDVFLVEENWEPYIEQELAEEKAKEEKDITQANEKIRLKAIEQATALLATHGFKVSK